MYGRQSMGLDIFGLDIGNLLETSGGQALNQFQTALIGQVAATPQVRQAVATSAQQASVTGFAESFLKNPLPWVGGAIGILAITFLVGRIR